MFLGAPGLRSSEIVHSSFKIVNDVEALSTLVNNSYVRVLHVIHVKHTTILHCFSEIWRISV